MLGGKGVEVVRPAFGLGPRAARGGPPGVVGGAAGEGPLHNRDQLTLASLHPGRSAPARRA
jgi:hypothetical protein